MDDDGPIQSIQLANGTTISFQRAVLDTRPFAQWTDLDVPLFLADLTELLQSATLGVDPRLFGTTKGDKDALRAVTHPPQADRPSFIMSSLDYANTLVKVAMGEDVPVWREPLLEPFFSSVNKRPPHVDPTTNEEQIPIAIPRRLHILPIAMPLYRSFYPALRAMVMASAPKFPLIPPLAGIEEQFKVRDKALFLELNTDLLQIANVVTGVLQIISSLVGISDAVAKRVSHDWAFIETVLLLAECSVNIAIIHYSNEPWKSISVYLFLYCKLILYAIHTADLSPVTKAFQNHFPTPQERATKSSVYRLWSILCDARYFNKQFYDDKYDHIRELMCTMYQLLEPDLDLLSIEGSTDDLRQSLKDGKHENKESRNNRGIDRDECDNCFIPKTAADLKRCSHCLVPRYCSAECQKVSWEKHKMVCFDAGIEVKVKKANSSGDQEEGGTAGEGEDGKAKIRGRRRRR